MDFSLVTLVIPFVRGFGKLHVNLYVPSELN
ncbi:hypothetical protein C8N28_0723 [Albibacterium bauzanense]|uniref:Uncharacterized protein n=1 Tax=Albibacterium bauzanense TaxID=653929 RepID=A0A4R1M225_9SPHI|nr:hypothetical protein C8N28_0723 [Albibacterium bauzanense]